MCTAITLQSGQNETFFGRTMDFSYDIEPHLYVMPQNYPWKNVINQKTFYNKYRFMGIGQQVDDLLGFFDGVNEKGFAAAALYFAGYARYNSPEEARGKEPVSSLDFLHYILGNCSCVADLSELLKHISIVGIPDPVTQDTAPLHWFAADKSGNCAVIEQTGRGLEIYRNPVGVLANSPDFSWHMTNLRNYANVTPEQPSSALWGCVPLTPFGQAAGTTPLPGGYTSPERFVRTAYQKTHIVTPKSRLETINACFHIMEGVSIPKGVVVTSRNTYDYTKYTAFINTGTCEYFFKTYDNIQVGTAGLFENTAPYSRLVNLGGI